MALVYDDFYKTQVNNLAGQKNQSLADLNKLYDSQISNLNAQYDAALNKAGSAYENQYRENAVQKLINERAVAENMANLGLTDSGLNRTQQTAVQLSYANNKGNIDRQRQSQMDALNLEKTGGISGIEQQRLAGQDEINKYYTNLAAQNATDAYSAYVKAEQEKYQAQLEAAEKLATQKPVYYKFLNSDMNGSGKEIYSFEDQNGKKQTFEKGINPYTGRRIAGYTNAQLNKYGVWNGYQPKGVVVDGQDYGKVQLADSQASDYQGHTKNIWKTEQTDINGRKHKKYWIWDDYKNGGSYIPVYKESNEWVVYN